MGFFLNLLDACLQPDWQPHVSSLVTAEASSNFCAWLARAGTNMKGEEVVYILHQRRGFKN